MVFAFFSFAQTTEESFKKANQLFVLYESERDKGTNIDGAYAYLLESYNNFQKVANAADNNAFISGIKNRLRAAYPVLENAVVYYVEQQNNSKALDFALPYVELPQHPLFRNELLPKSAQYPSIVYSAGIAAFKLQKYTQAISLFQEYLHTDSKVYAKDAYTYLNMIYQAQKNLKEQENILLRANEQYPLVLDFLYNLVNVYITAQHIDKVLSTIDKILAIDQNNEKVLPVKARILETSGKNEEALQIYQRLYTLNPGNFELVTGLARSNFNYATEIINNGATIADDIQYALVRQKAAGYLMDAKDLFVKILEKDPTLRQYMVGLANVYHYMDMIPEYKVLNQLIADGADYSLFAARMEAYSALQQQNPAAQTEDAAIPRPQNPAKLVIRIDEFAESSQNKIIDAGESFAVTFTVQNQGLGDAYNIRLRLSEQQGLDRFFDGSKEMDGGNIPAGASKQYTMRYIVDRNLPQGNVAINIYAFEANGFDADPAELIVATNDFAMPRLAVADHQFFAAEGSSITLGDNGKLTVAIRNNGSVTANQVRINFKLPRNVFTTDVTDITVDSIPPGDVSVVDCGFLVNKRFDQDSIAVLMAVSENSKSSAINEVFRVKVGQYLTAANTLRIDGVGTASQPTVRPSEKFSLTFKSELLENIPEGTPHEHRYALIIGNEDYSVAGANAEINVPYAVNDAAVFREYGIRLFGIPAKHIKYVANATAGIMHEQLDWLVNMAGTDPDAELFFFFSGHGNNDERTKDAFLVPVDVSGKNIRFGISLEELYAELSKHPVKAAYVFLDACFSGGFKGEEALVAQKAVRVVPKTGMPRGNTISFSSSSGDQTSSVYHEKKQGYFTYYLIKTLQETSGDVTMKDLFAKTAENVRRATTFAGKVQEPQITVSPSVTYDWENLKLKTGSPHEAF
ncbi:MAG: caspase family protein [Bacteroidales bacterium]|jgi:uncharacterized repeat protein (TIGR01451 family)|nr:caspase family protein [Bacteroidales bacterium]